MSTWTDVEWTSLDTVEEADLDTMQGNLDYLREISDHRVLATFPAIPTGRSALIGAHTPGTAQARLLIPALSISLGPVTLANPTAGLLLFQDLNRAMPASVVVGALREDSILGEWRVNSGSPWQQVIVAGAIVWRRDVDMNYLDTEIYLEGIARQTPYGVSDPNYFTLRFANLRFVGKRTTTS